MRKIGAWYQKPLCIDSRSLHKSTKPFIIDLQYRRSCFAGNPNNLAIDHRQTLQSKDSIN
jgi:hypothetical protein